jgi:hypothetical protein
MAFPMRLALKKARAETGKELVSTFAVYATLLILLSLPFVLLDWPQGIGWSGWPGYLPGAFYPVRFREFPRLLYRSALFPHGTAYHIPRLPLANIVGSQYK